MHRDELLRKIRACLRLSKSANEHEAAAALRQAKLLMERHGISSAEALAGDVSEREAKTGRRGAEVHKSVHFLVWMIGAGFRCKSVVNVGKACSITVTFYGTGADAEIAAYAFEVLRRQMDAACLKHIARVRVRKNREARGEEFRLGWLSAVRQLFPTTDLTAELEQKLEAYKTVRWSDLSAGKSKEIDAKRAKGGDYFAGVLAGRQARLNSGLSGEQQRGLEHLT